jgi:hypothetical protein
MAVGSYSHDSGDWMLALQWNGARWSTQRPPNPTGLTQGSLLAVSCSSTTACTAVGSYLPRNSELIGFCCASTLTLAEHWDGSGWSIQPTPNPANAARGKLTGVSCWSPSRCIAVGTYHTTTNHDEPLVERWNGRRWSIEPIPDPEWGGVLMGVSCWSPTGCVAVGGYYRGSDVADTNPLVERWNGTTWSIQPAPDTANGVTVMLTSVSCVSPTACTAVGSPGASYWDVVVERWDGATWSIQPAPQAPMQSQFGDVLNGVSCASASVCTAVGTYYPTVDYLVSLAEGWDGTAWSIEATSNAGHSYSLNGVSCASASTCIAVGSHDGSSLTEQWDAGSWSIQPSPNPPGSTQSNLAAVSCTTTTACTAIGSYNATAYGQLPLVEHWSGTH